MLPTLHTLITDAAFALKSGSRCLALLPKANGETLRVASADGATWVEFAVAGHERYTTLTISDWQGIADQPDASLHVSVPQDSRLHLTELDVMTSFSDRGEERQISWLSPSKQFGDNPPGAFAVFEADSDEMHDETLLHIWVAEGQPHPRTGQTWDLAHARAWLAEWQRTFASRSQMVVNAESLQELYDLVPYAEKADIDEIYIFTNTWRPDKFWPMTDVNWALNPTVFPNGHADLRAYSDYLAERGIRLCLHYVSGGIGLHDPVYMGTHPHPELATWGSGTLLAELDGDQTSLRVTQGAGMTWPLADREFLAHSMIRIGNELVVPQHTVVEADGTWSMSDCQRGACDSVASAHEPGSTVTFLVVPYGQNVVPDNNSPLLYEIADHFASLLNECRVTHAEFDGAEIHCYDGRYGYLKFAQRIYEQMDHAITSHDSSGSAARCFFEYRFKSTQHVLRGSCRFTHGNWLVPFQVDSASRPASTVLDANFFLAQGHWGGAMGISKPEPMFGVTTQMLATHGMTEQLLATLHAWKTACRRLTDEQHRLIEASLETPSWPMPEASRHRVSDTVFQVAPHGDALIPTRVMTRQTGDIKWQLGQEYGPVSPHQFVRPGESVELFDDFGEQTPDFILRLLPAFAADAESIPAAELASDADEVFDGKDFFVEGNESAGASSRTVTANIDLLPPDFDDLLQGHNDQATPEYHVRDLPAYPMRVDLSYHRGLAIELEGDGSGALVLVQLTGRGCRDYVIPVDFVGVRTIEIPCGEASWARADWGWRMGTKTMDYAQVAEIRIGLGMLPAQTSALIRIRRLTALAEQHVSLEDPCIRINTSSLQIEGSIPTGHYLVYAGGDTADVYDPNWHHVAQHRISHNNLRARSGANTVTIETSSTTTHPWMTMQVLVKDAPLTLAEPKRTCNS